MSDGHRVVVYYQTQYDHSVPANTPYGFYVSPLPLIHVITHLILAAFHINAHLPITIALNDNAPDEAYYTQMWADIAVMKQSGIKVLGLLGGAAPGSYECLTPDTFDTFYPQLRDVIKTYDIDGMDLDVEQAESLDDIVHLITQLKQDFGPDFIITLAPVASALEEGANLSGFDYIQLEQKMGSQISWYNAQFYSGFGSVFPDDQYINITQYGFGASRLVATTLTNEDDGFGYVDPDEVVSSIQALCEKFGDSFGGVAGWEYFNSQPSYSYGQPWQWATLMTNTMQDVEAKAKAKSSGNSKQRRSSRFFRSLEFEERARVETGAA